MADKTGIEWADATWNPVVGCAVVSPGCTRCYAMRMAARIERMQPASHYAGTTIMVNGNPVWTGKIAEAPNRIWTQPLRWRRPRSIFVNSMGDLFAPGVAEASVDRALRIMLTAPDHRYIVLTKRPDRMRAYLERLRGDTGYVMRAREDPIALLCEGQSWPPAGILVGTTVEDQTRADERRDPMASLDAMGWRTLVSYEPALGPVDWHGWEFLSWLISGGESGPRARASHPDWHRAARDFCADHDIPFFFKQWGGWVLTGGDPFRGEQFSIMRGAGRLIDGVEHNAVPEQRP